MIDVPEPSSAPPAEPIHPAFRIPFGEDPDSRSSALAYHFRHIRPHWRHYIRYVDVMAREGNTAAKKFKQSWDDLPIDLRRAHLPEQLCEISGVGVFEIGEIVNHAVHALENVEFNMLRARKKNDQLQASSYYGESFIEAFKDRELVAKVTGAMPMPKGTVVNVDMRPAIAAGSPGISLGNGATQVLDMDAEIIGLSQVLELPAAKTIPDDDEEPDEDPEPDEDQDDD